MARCNIMSLLYRLCLINILCRIKAILHYIRSARTRFGIKVCHSRARPRQNSHGTTKPPKSAGERVNQMALILHNQGLSTRPRTEAKHKASPALYTRARHWSIFRSNLEHLYERIVQNPGVIIDAHSLLGRTALTHHANERQIPVGHQPSPGQQNATSVPVRLSPTSKSKKDRRTRIREDSLVDLSGVNVSVSTAIVSHDTLPQTHHILLFSFFVALNIVCLLPARAIVPS